MKIQYLGTGAAEGIPALFCNCDFCTAARRNGTHRSRAQVLMDGELSVDFPPDAFLHGFGQDVDLSSVAYLLVTHAHIDHFYPSDLILRGYKYARKLASPRLAIYGNAEVAEVFREGTRREMREEIADTISVHTISAFETVSFGDWTVSAFPAQHTSRDPLLYLIERNGKHVLHLTDTGTLREDALAFLASLRCPPVDLITFDCTFLFSETEKSARHMGIDENLRVFRRLAEAGLADGHTLRVITHFSHNSEPTAEALLCAERDYGMIAAYDGMSIEI